MPVSLRTRKQEVYTHLAFPGIPVLFVHVARPDDGSGTKAWACYPNGSWDQI